MPRQFRCKNCGLISTPWEVKPMGDSIGSRAIGHNKTSFFCRKCFVPVEYVRRFKGRQCSG